MILLIKLRPFIYNIFTVIKAFLLCCLRAIFVFVFLIKSLLWFSLVMRSLKFTWTLHCEYGWVHKPLLIRPLKSPLHSKMCFSYCSFIWLFDLHNAEWCMFDARRLFSHSCAKVVMCELSLNLYQSFCFKDAVVAERRFHVVVKHDFIFHPHLPMIVYTWEQHNVTQNNTPLLTCCQIQKPSGIMPKSCCIVLSHHIIKKPRVTIFFNLQKKFNVLKMQPLQRLLGRWTHIRLNVIHADHYNTTTNYW